MQTSSRNGGWRAVAPQVRVEAPLFTHVLFPTYVGAVLWSGLLLRDARRERWKTSQRSSH